jgi:hypothetical protein
VAEYASLFIRVRAWGVLSALISFVAAGTYRGVKDTVTPLQVCGGGLEPGCGLFLAWQQGMAMQTHPA